MVCPGHLHTGTSLHPEKIPGLCPVYLSMVPHALLRTAITAPLSTRMLAVTPFIWPANAQPLPKRVDKAGTLTWASDPSSSAWLAVLKGSCCQTGMGMDTPSKDGILLYSCNSCKSLSIQSGHDHDCILRVLVAVAPFAEPPSCPSSPATSSCLRSFAAATGSSSFDSSTSCVTWRGLAYDSIQEGLVQQHQW